MVDGSNTHNMNFLGGICAIIKRNQAVMLERDLKECFLYWVIKEMTLKLKTGVIIRRNGHVAIWMKKKTFQREGTDNIKALEWEQNWCVQGTKNKNGIKPKNEIKRIRPRWSEIML